MKKLLVLVAVSVLVYGQALGAAEDDASAIRKVMAEQAVAWSNGDVAGYMKGYENSPETTFIGAQVRKGYEPILKRYQQAYKTPEQMGTLTFDQIEVRLLASTCGRAEYATVTGRFHLERKAKGEATKDEGIFSLVWHRTAEGWKILLDHTS